MFKVKNTIQKINNLFNRTSKQSFTIEKIKNPKLFEYIFIILFTSISIIDSINGYIIYNTNYSISVGKIYRILMIAILGIIIILSSKISNYKYIILGGLYFVFINLINSNSLGLFIKNSEYVIKLALPILILESYKALYKKALINKNIILKILEINTVLFPLMILVAKIIGGGRKTYSHSGFKGYFNSTNELSIILLVSFIYCFNRLYKYSFKSKSSIKYYILIVINIIFMILLGTKTSFIGIVIVIGYYIFKESSRKLKLTIVGIGISLVIIITPILQIFGSSQINNIIERQKYLFKLYDGNVITYLLSGRDRYLIEINELLNGDENNMKFLFGSSPEKVRNVLGDKLNMVNGKETEMDFFDTYFYYGLIGTALISIYYYNIFRKTKKNLYGRTSLLTMLGFSFFAGHILYGAMAGTYLGLVLCVCNEEKSNEKNIGVN